jgi:hypothetical protein
MEAGTKGSDLVDNLKDTISTLPGFKRDGQVLKPYKIAILGTCPSRGLAPIEDPTWQIWTIGPGGKNANRWERLYEVHDQETWPAGFHEYMEELEKVEPPRQILVKDVMPSWPAAVVYPRLQRMAKYGKMWFSSQISYALADALEECPTDIGIYGIDLESGEEYQVQFTGAKYFVQLAQLAGINIHMPSGCALMRDPSPYPDSWETHLAATLDSKLEYLGSMVAEKTAQHGTIAAEINLINGEISAFQFMRNLYVLHGINPLQSGPPKRDLTTENKVDIILDLLQNR